MIHIALECTHLKWSIQVHLAATEEYCPNNVVRNKKHTKFVSHTLGSAEFTSPAE